MNYPKAHGSASGAREKRTKKVSIQAPATQKMGSKPKASRPVRKIRAAVIWLSRFPGRMTADRTEVADNYEGAFVANGDFIEPSEGHEHEEYGAEDFNSTDVHVHGGVVFRFHGSCDDVQGRGHTAPPHIAM